MTKRQKKSHGRMVSVLLAVHHPLARRYLELLLKQDAAFKVREDLVNPERKSAPSLRTIVILDAQSIPSAFGRYLLDVRAKLPEAKFLVVGPELSDTETCRLLLFGIHGFISYEHVHTQLVQGVRRISGGRLMVPQRVLEQFAQYASSVVGKHSRGPRLPFSSRERETLNLLQQGLSNKEIAAAMQISERTVKFHLGNVFSKLGVHDRHSLADMLRAAMLPNTGQGVEKPAANDKS